MKENHDRDNEAMTNTSNVFFEIQRQNIDVHGRPKKVMGRYARTYWTPEGYILAYHLRELDLLHLQSKCRCT